MKIPPVEAELFHADGGTDGRTDRLMDRHDKANRELITISQTLLKIGINFRFCCISITHRRTSSRVEV